MLMTSTEDTEDAPEAVCDDGGLRDEGVEAAVEPVEPAVKVVLAVDDDTDVAVEEAAEAELEVDARSAGSRTVIQGWFIMSTRVIRSLGRTLRQRRMRS